MPFSIPRTFMRLLLSTGVVALLFAGPKDFARSAENTSRPNIIVIMADDMGYSDLGCYGGEIQTPNLDRLASQGLRLSQFYNCALCGPTRSALLTGLNPHQVGISGWTGLLNNRCITAFELFKQAGYRTCAVGRLDMVTAEVWHDPANISKYVDEYLGSTGHTGPGNYFKAVHSAPFFKNGKPYELPEDSYKTDLITDFATEFIAEQASSKEPFYMYVSQYAPHWPLHAKPDDMEKYRQLYRDLGWDKARANRYERLVSLGLIDGESELSPRDPSVKDWSQSKHQQWEADRMAAYAGQIDSLDQSVGRIVQALRDSKQDRNTLVLFFSDNGASNQAAYQPDKPGKIWRIDGTLTRSGNDPSIPPGGADTFLTAGPAWSNVSNAPFRNHKQSNHEGGIASPFIAWWPGVIMQAGEISHEPAHVTDVLATCLDVANIEYPSEYHGRKVLPPAGQSILSILKGGKYDRPRTLGWATNGNRALRIGSWKLVATKAGPWELYDLDHDRTEMHNLAKQEPARVKQMAAAFEAWKKKDAP
jgi:arylsulfatase